MIEPSALIRRRLDLFEQVDDDAKSALLSVATDVREVAKGERIRRAGGPAAEFWFVAEGWFYSSGTLADGRRQVYAFHLPGDVMGLQDLGWEIAVCDVAAATNARAVRVCKDDFRAVVTRYPMLAGFFLTFGIYDHTRLIDRLRVVGRMPAVKRVAHLLLQLADEATEPHALTAQGQDERRFALPIDQGLIGDAVGLTNISVSRMMSELVDRGFVEREGRTVRLPRLRAMKAFCDYTERRRAVPLSWIMQPAAEVA